MVVVTMVTVVVAAVVEVVKVLVWAGGVVNISVDEVLVVDAFGVVSIEADVLVDLWMDALAEIGGVPGIGVDVLVGVSVTILAAVMTAVRWDTPAPIEGLSFGAALSRWPMTAFDCARVLQARMPSYHV